MARTDGAALHSSSADLATRLSSRTSLDPDYWDFAQLGKRRGSHALFQYPAMMVPELQGALLDDVVATLGRNLTIYDPFAGSGTVMTEALRRGLGFVGGDINPMAILLLSLKSAPPTLEEAEAGLAQLNAAPVLQVPGDIPVFPGIDKWFSADVQRQLGGLRSRIREVGSIRVRRFLWVCLAETIRLCSNSRISTFKLHAYSAADLAVRSVDANRTFAAVSIANIKALQDESERLRAATAECSWNPPKVTLFPGPASSSWDSEIQPQILMTSPPYGDNKTTVPYGQHSYLALQWIDSADIPGGVTKELVASTSAIDSASLGGSIAGAMTALDELRVISPTTVDFALSLDRSSLTKKIVAFSRDYVAALTMATLRLAPSAYAFITLGQRRVGGQLFPLVELTQDVLASVGHERVDLIERALPRRKRIGPRNSEGSTMAHEYILVTQHRAGT